MVGSAHRRDIHGIFDHGDVLGHHALRELRCRPGIIRQRLDGEAPAAVGDESLDLVVVRGLACGRAEPAVLDPLRIERLALDAGLGQPGLGEDGIDDLAVVALIPKDHDGRGEVYLVGDVEAEDAGAALILADVEDFVPAQLPMLHGEQRRVARDPEVQVAGLVDGFLRRVSLACRAIMWICSGTTVMPQPGFALRMVRSDQGSSSSSAA